MKARGARRKGREAAVQLLYLLDARDLWDSPQDLVSAFFEGLTDECCAELDPEGQSFARDLALGVARDLDRVDALIRAAAKNWRLERMSRVDRAVLRLGAHELTRAGGPPWQVAISEAVELAEIFGTETSTSFVNGVLSRVARDLQPRR